MAVDRCIDGHSIVNHIAWKILHACKISNCHVEMRRTATSTRRSTASSSYNLDLLAVVQTEKSHKNEQFEVNLIMKASGRPVTDPLHEQASMYRRSLYIRSSGHEAIERDQDQDDPVTSAPPNFWGSSP